MLPKIAYLYRILVLIITFCTSHTKPLTNELETLVKILNFNIIFQILSLFEFKYFFYIYKNRVIFPSLVTMTSL